MILMKKIPLYVFLVLMLSLFASHSFAEKKHKIYKNLPCNFNGVKVTGSARLHSDVKGGRCCPECTGYEKRRGTTMRVKRGTPVVAIADMKVLKIEDDSGEQRTTSHSKKYGMVEGIDFYSKKEIVKPFDAIRIYFVDTKGNIILYYHLKETHLVNGFNKGKCKIPFEYKWGRKTFRPEDCGGYSKELIKNNFNVKKGQVIGLSGNAYVAHFALGIAVPIDEDIKNYLLKINQDTNSLFYIATVKSKKDNLVSFKSEKRISKSVAEDEMMKMCRIFFEVDGEQMQNSCYIDSVVQVEGIEYGLKNKFYNSPYSATEKYMRFTAPQRDFKWENLPTVSDAYLFPVMSKKYLKEIGYKK